MAKIPSSFKTGGGAKFPANKRPLKGGAPNKAKLAKSQSGPAPAASAGPPRANKAALRSAINVQRGQNNG